MHILMGSYPLYDIDIYFYTQKASERIYELSTGLPQGSKKSILSQKEILEVFYAVFVTYNQNSFSEDNLAGMDIAVSD